MAEERTGTPDESDDPTRSMVVERVRREDGRYLIYYDWPGATAGDGPERDDAPDGAPDV